MTTRVIVLAAAKRDVASAHRWYESEQPGLGERNFSTSSTPRSAGSPTPRQTALVDIDVRRLLVRRFPYSIYFRIRNTTARVLAIVHQHRAPSVWQRRTRR